MQVSTATAAETKDQFLQLLVTQLQNQDPLEPMKQEDFLSQLAQFSTLEGIEDLNSTIEKQVTIQEDTLRFQQLTQAATLVGNSVVYQHQNSDGEVELREGRVESVAVNGPRIEFQIGSVAVTWDKITKVLADN